MRAGVARAFASAFSSAFLVGLAVCAAGCDAGETKLIGADYPAAMCSVPVTAPPAGTDAFYKKYLGANGIPVQASSAVSDRAVSQACLIVARMTSARADVRAQLIAQQQRVTLLGVNEVTTDVPEYSNLYTIFPGQDWDRLRGVGATLMIPVSSAGEENVLCTGPDPFAGENVLVQTFATAVLLGVTAADASFDARLQAAYSDAMNAGKWQNTFAATNPIEYYAEGVQDWFDANPDVSPPDGTHNDVNTRAELRAYDPALAALIAETMLDDGWRPRCPSK
ncbi:MAG TPA: hypothetical protein VHM31_02345 [Polyangia bacterium]|nr:hypothetical protein [Polyangia bacterium]